MEEGGVFGIRSNRHLVISAPIYIVKSAPSQFGSSVKNYFVIIKYLYIKKKKKKLDLLASTKYNL
jgi:hypothetical protein